MTNKTREALQAIIDLHAGFDADGSLGPRKPLSWESVARVSADYARAALQQEVPAEPVEWQPFDYANHPDDGVMWVAVSSPETDCDVDDYGKTVGWHTGRTDRAVCLVRFSAGENAEHEFDTLDDWELGKVPDDGTVTHFAPVVLPKLPKLPEAAPHVHRWMSALNPRVPGSLFCRECEEMIEPEAKEFAIANLKGKR